MLSFSRGKPIARIKGGKHNGKIIHIFDPSQEPQTCCDKCSEKCKKKKCCKNCKFKEGGCCSLKGGSNISKKKKIKEETDDDYSDGDDYERYDFDDPDYDPDPYDYMDKDYLHNKRYGGLGFKTTSELNEALRKGRKPKVERKKKIFDELYDKGKKVLDERLSKEIHIDDGMISVLPRMEKDQVQNLYIAAPSGAGKSTWASNFIDEYKLIFPKNRRFLFSRGTEDKALDKPGTQRIQIDEKMIEDPIDGPKELKNSLCIFDDIDTFQNGQLSKTIQKLRDDILETGRKSGISTISTSHQILNYKRTRDVLNECQVVVLFPKGGGVYAITEFLKRYCGLTPEQIKRILDLPSRWVAINKTYPMWIAYQNGVYLL